MYNGVMPTGKKEHVLLEKNIEDRTGICKKCGPVNIYPRKKSWQCAIAKKEQRGTPPAGVRTHGMGWMSQKDRVQRIQSQSGKCAICQRSDKVLQRDHDHDTRTDRGFLCGNCNRGIGLLQDNPEILDAAAAYLRWHNKKHEPFQRDCVVEL